MDYIQEQESDELFYVVKNRFLINIDIDWKEEENAREDEKRCIT